MGWKIDIVEDKTDKEKFWIDLQGGCDVCRFFSHRRSDKMMALNAKHGGDGNRVSCVQNLFQSMHCDGYIHWERHSDK